MEIIQVLMVMPSVVKGVATDALTYTYVEIRRPAFCFEIVRLHVVCGVCWPLESAFYRAMRKPLFMAGFKVYLRCIENRRRVCRGSCAAEPVALMAKRHGRRG